MNGENAFKACDLLPCPFCGGEATLFEGMLPTPIGRHFGVTCVPGPCQASIDGCETAEAAIKAWNTRASSWEDERAELVGALELFEAYGCPRCLGDCASANPPILVCPMKVAQDALRKAKSLPSPPGEGPSANSKGASS